MILTKYVVYTFEFEKKTVMPRTVSNSFAKSKKIRAQYFSVSSADESVSTARWKLTSCGMVRAEAKLKVRSTVVYVLLLRTRYYHAYANIRRVTNFFMCKLARVCEIDYFFLESFAPGHRIWRFSKRTTAVLKPREFTFRAFAGGRAIAIAIAFCFSEEIENARVG